MQGTACISIANSVYIRLLSNELTKVQLEKLLKHFTPNNNYLPIKNIFKGERLSSLSMISEHSNSKFDLIKAMIIMANQSGNIPVFDDEFAKKAQTLIDTKAVNWNDVCRRINSLYDKFDQIGGTYAKQKKQLEELKTIIQKCSDADKAFIKENKLRNDKKKKKINEFQGLVLTTESLTNFYISTCLSGIHKVPIITANVRVQSDLVYTAILQKLYMLENNKLATTLKELESLKKPIPLDFYSAKAFQMKVVDGSTYLWSVGSTQQFTPLKKDIEGPDNHLYIKLPKFERALF